MKLVIAIVFVFVHSLGWTQFTIIPTGTLSSITEIKTKGEFVLINGIDGYLSKCYGDCEELINLTVVGDFEYKRDHLNLIDTSTFYIASHTDFPHHGYIFQTIDGGYSWDVILDTSDFMFREFFMFDTANGLLVSSLYNATITANNGISWESESHGLPFTSGSLKINDSTAVMGVTESFRYSTDKGMSWSGTSFVQSPPTDFFANTIDSIYAVTYGGTGQFFTYNFALGESGWVDKPIPNFYPRDVYVKSPNEIYVIGQILSTGTCGILKTTNLGNTWGIYDTEIVGMLNDLVFLNDSLALIGGSNGLLIKWNSFDTPFEFASVEDYETDNLIKIYPNPIKDNQKVTITVVQNAFVKVNLLDFNGQLVLKVFEENLLAGSKMELSINFDNLPKGVYYYTIDLGQKFYQKKIIKL